MSKIGSLDRTVGANLCRYAFGQLAALMHDHHVVRQGHHQADVMLDQQNRYFVSQTADQLRRILGVAVVAPR